MSEYVAARRVRIGEKLYQKGDSLPIPAQQFHDLEPTGLVERAKGTKTPQPKEG